MGKYFGTDGVRGLANDTLPIEYAYKIGRFLGKYAKEIGVGKICVGKDTRLSSSMYENMLSAGISASGCDAYQIGYCSTPCLAYVAQEDGFDLGVMISASHNPYHDNGIKVFSNDGVKFKEEVLLQIEDYIDNPVGIPLAINEDIGQIYQYSEGIEHYKTWIKSLYDTDLSKYKVIVDCANGSNSKIAYPVLRDLGCNVTAINVEPNGININNHCGSTHLESLKENIALGNYDIGFAFDGDADRCLAVLPDGQEANGDKIMFVLAKYLKVMGELTNDTVVVTGYSNIGLHKALNKYGIKTDVVDNGDKYVLQSMLNNDYALGGEQSGHIIIKKDCNFGDGLKTAVAVLNAMDYFNSDFASLTSDLVIYPQVLVNQKVKDKKVVLQDLDILNKVEEIKNKLGSDGQILVRASGTEPLVRVMVEAETKELCDCYVNEVIELIKAKGYAD